MKSRTTFFTALLLAGKAFAQNASAIGPIIQALQQENLTTLAMVAQGVANTTVGQGLISLLTSGQPLTVFAPDNNAFTGVPSNISNNPNLLAEILSYHVIPGNVNFSFFGSSGNTILRTALNSSDQVFLGPGDQHQVLVGRLNGSNVHILNQNTDVESYSSTTIPSTNITLNKVNAVIDLPGDFDNLFTSNNLTAFRTAAQQAGVLETLNRTHGLTIFAPSDAAFAKAASDLGGSMNMNQTTLQNVLLNHVLNGSVIYSSELAAGNFTTAAGEPLTITNSSSGFTLSSSGANSTTNASFVTTDLISWSGVLHIIDTVLLNNQSSPGDASSAYASATSSAASEASALETATVTAPGGGLVGTPGGGASATARGGSGTGAAVSLKGVGAVGFAGVVGVVGGMMVLL